MAEVQLQQMEEEALPLLKPFVHSRAIAYKPLISVLSEPIDLLHCESSQVACAFRELSGTWSNVVARPGVASASREYSVRLGPATAPYAPVYLFRDGELAERGVTDEKGRIVFSFSTSEPSSHTYTASLTPKLVPFKTPTQESFKLTVWFVRCLIRNKTDVWWRLAGRSFEEALPRIFWREAPHSVIGLAAPSGTQVFVDVVPVFSDKSLTLEYAVSAWCNTPEPNPPADKCREYRKKTWWEFRVEAFNGKETKRVSGDLNLDRHLRVSITSDNVSATVVKPAGAET